jgi:AcrR family transcriptional regulator
VARTTLYRHFHSSSHLLAATFERLLPQVTTPAPTSGPLREQLIELLSRQAALFNDAPLHVTTLAWLSLGPTGSNAQAEDRHTSGALRTRVVDQYRQPFDAILTSPKAQAELNDFDQELALCQLVGPLAFARMTGLRTITHNDCANIVDDFLAAHQQPTATPKIEHRHQEDGPPGALSSRHNEITMSSRLVFGPFSPLANRVGDGIEGPFVAIIGEAVRWFPFHSEVRRLAAG